VADAIQNADICLVCIGDAYLRQQLEEHAETVACKYCGSPGPGLSISRLAEEVDPTLRATLRQGRVSAHFSIDSDSPDYEQDGEGLSWVLQEELQIDSDPADALAAVLIVQDPADVRGGDDPFFDDDQLYERDEVYDWDFAEAWREFAEGLKHRQRFFGASALDQLGLILGEAGSDEANELPVTVLGDSESPARLYRARRATSAEEARRFLASAASELSAPAPDIALPGRMNPAGIPVFYGALSEGVAVSEVRPPVGGVVVVGSFAPTRPLRLLDLTRLGHSFTGSIFRPGYHDRAARQQFLQSFHYLVTRPVQPAEELLEYLPTQAVAEYIRNVLGFDGILYASAQVGELDASGEEEEATGLKVHSSCNVVVFGDVALRAAVDPGQPPRNRRVAVEHPVKYELESAHGVWVRRVSYDFSTINLDDETDDGVADADDEAGVEGLISFDP
jgi:hypothetical protein